MSGYDNILLGLPSGMDGDDAFSNPHSRFYNSLHNPTHFAAASTPRDQNVDNRVDTPNRISAAHDQEPPGTGDEPKNDQHKDRMLRHDAFLTANHLWPGKPKPKPTTDQPSQNLQLDGRIHDWVMRKNNTNADALVRTARQEYYNSVNKHDSYY
jgi:hypothetical protein